MIRTIALTSALALALTVSAPRQAEAFFVLPAIAGLAMFGALLGGTALGSMMTPAAVTSCSAKGYRYTRSGSTYDPRTGQFNGYSTHCSNEPIR